MSTNLPFPDLPEDQNAKNAKRAKQKGDGSGQARRFIPFHLQFFRMSSDQCLMPSRNRITFQLMISPKEGPLNFRWILGQMKGKISLAPCFSAGTSWMVCSSSTSPASGAGPSAAGWKGGENGRPLEPRAEARG